MRRTLLVALAALPILALGIYAVHGQGDGHPVTAVNAATTDPLTRPPAIAAHGVAKVSGAPDVLTVVLGVQTRAARAKDALDANSQKAAALIGVLKGRGVAEKDLQTSQLNISPTFDTSGQHITGYQVDNQVTAKLRDLAGAGALIDAAAASAGDAVRVQSLGFSIDDDSALRQKARAEAVRAAHAQAQQMADAAGVKLGHLRSISEIPASTPSPYTNYNSAPGLGAAAGSIPAPIQPGTQELSLAVDVVYDVEQ